MEKKCLNDIGKNILNLMCHFYALFKQVLEIHCLTDKQNINYTSISNFFFFFVCVQFLAIGHRLR